ncbi:hypothetical protein [Streptomyces xanthochromogenes]|uniref:hypothetical protein n=1 Tax=Streptomyces xanthochromogenes TaxID=67384 RepID=UPI0034158E63
MNTGALNALAGVITAAMKQDRTPMGIALAIESAGMLRSPETAAELEELRSWAAALETAGRPPLPRRHVCRCRTDNDGDANGWIKYQARDGEFIELPCRDHQSAEDPHDSPLHHSYTTARLREDQGADDGR